MREILFRAKVRFNGNHFHSGEFVEGSLILKVKTTFIHVIDYDNLGNLIREVDVEVDPETVCQYTGLTDKNGVKIFEGDQLSICAGYSSTVEFQDGMFVSVYKHPEDGEIIPLLDAICKDTIIIGNIFNNL